MSSLSSWSEHIPAGVVIGEAYDVQEPGDVIQGWMDTAGRFYPVNYQEHDTAADAIIQNQPKLRDVKLPPFKWAESGYKRVVDNERTSGEPWVSNTTRLERLGWLHMYANGAFYAFDRLGNEDGGRITEDQFWSLQRMAQVRDHNEYSAYLLSSIRDAGGDRFLADMAGDWVHPTYE